MLTTSFDSGMCQNQERFESVRKQTVITPPSITSRREPRKWPQMAALRNFGFGLAESEAGAEQAGLAGGVDDDFGADESLPLRRPLKRPRRRRVRDADGAVAFEHDFQHAGAAVDFHAFLGGVVEQELIELGPLDVPRAAALARIVPREQKRRRLLAAAADELHADLLRRTSPSSARRARPAARTPNTFRASAIRRPCGAARHRAPAAARESRRRPRAPRSSSRSARRR